MNSDIIFRATNLNIISWIKKVINERFVLTLEFNISKREFNYKNKIKYKN